MFLWVGCIAVCIIICWVLWSLPAAQIKKYENVLSKKELPNMENEFRKTLAQIISSVLLLIGLLFTWNQISASLDANRMNEVRLRSERFAKAVEHIGDKTMEVRIGGMFSLQQLAEASKQDCSMGEQILSAYIRRRTIKNATQTENLPEDIHCAVKVLGQIHHFHKNNVDLGTKVDLNDVRIVGASLMDSDFKSVDFQMSDLRQSDFRNSHLEGAKFTGADLSGSNFSGSCLQKSDLRSLRSAEAARFIKANLKEANLDHANLANADFSFADLSDAKLAGANLSGTILKGANLGKAVGILKEQLTGAITDQETILPILAGK